MSIITLNSTVRWAEETLFRNLGEGEESVVVCLKTSTYFGLDGVGARIGELIGDGVRLDQVLHQVVREYEVDQAAAALDLLALVSELARRGLVVATEAGTPG